MIKLQVIGHLGSDCRVANVDGKDVINFSVAHSESWKDAQGVKKEKTIWVDCSYWPNSIKIADYLKKGTQVYVEGTPAVRTYENRNGGTGVSLTCRVFSVQLLGSGGGNKNEQQQANEGGEPAPASTQEGYKPVETTASTEGGGDLPF